MTDTIKCRQCKTPTSVNKTELCMQCKLVTCACGKAFTIRTIGQTECSRCKNNRQRKIKNGWQLL
jgi:hypothetical protein